MTLQGIIVFAHGSRDPLWHRPMLAVAQQVQTLDASVAVRCAYLEITQPDLATVVAELVQLGVTQLSVLPLFLGVGRHAREDLPVLVQELRARYPALHIRLQDAVGEDPRLVQLLAQLALD